jgi:predicted alpha/beta superfamily hydrolase
MAELRTWRLLLAALALSAPVQAKEEAAPKVARAELWNSEQFVVHSKILNRDLLVQVAKPFAAPKAPIPAVYLLDGNHFFASAASAMLAGFTGDYAPAYFIGIGYVEQDPLHWFRQRLSDLVHVRGLPLGNDPMVAGVETGGGAAFQRFLVEELRPLVEKKYPIDPARTTLAGVSLGGLFTARVMLDQPAAFGSYLIGSPSLWAEPALIARAKTVALAPGTKVFVAAGALEKGQAAFAGQFAAALRANPSGAALSEWIVPDEDHNTFPPAFFARAFKTVLPPSARPAPPAK